MSLQLWRSVSGGAAAARALAPSDPAIQLSPDVTEWIRTYSFAAYDRKRRGKDMVGLVGANRSLESFEVDWCELVDCDYRNRSARPLSPIDLASLRKKVEVIQAAGPRRITGLFRTCVNDSFSVSQSDIAVLDELLPGCHRIILSKPHDDGSMTIRVFNQEQNGGWLQSSELQFSAVALVKAETTNRAVVNLLHLPLPAPRLSPALVKLLLAGGLLGALAGFGVSYLESRTGPPVPSALPVAFSPLSQSVRQVVPALPSSAPTKPAETILAASLPRAVFVQPPPRPESSPASSIALDKMALAKMGLDKMALAKTEDPPEIVSLPATHPDVAVPRWDPAPPPQPEPPSNRIAVSPEPQPPVQVKTPPPAVVPSRPLTAIAPSTRPFGERLVYGATQIDVQVSIDSAGRVTAARLAAAVSKPNEMLARQALQAARQWTFYPATRDGKPVPSEYVIQFRFR